MIPVFGALLDVSMAAVSLCSVEKLVRAIEEFPDLQALRLEGNTIGVEAARVIGKALESRSQLQVRAPASAVGLFHFRFMQKPFF